MYTNSDSETFTIHKFEQGPVQKWGASKSPRRLEVFTNQIKIYVNDFPSKSNKEHLAWILRESFSFRQEEKSFSRAKESATNVTIVTAGSSLSLRINERKYFRS